MATGLPANHSAALSALQLAVQTLCPLRRWDPENDNYLMKIIALPLYGLMWFVLLRAGNTLKLVFK